MRSESAPYVGDIPAPPKYKKSVFQNTTLRRLRGSLDVRPGDYFIRWLHQQLNQQGWTPRRWPTGDAKRRHAAGVAAREPACSYQEAGC